MSEKKKNFRLPGCFANPEPYDLANTLDKLFEKEFGFKSTCVNKIKKVVYNEPTTAVVWSDDTVTKCTCSKDDVFDPEKGLLICILKKLYGSKEVKETLTWWSPAPSIVREVNAWNKSVDECNDRTNGSVKPFEVKYKDEITLKDVRRRIKGGEY